MTKANFRRAPMMPSSSAPGRRVPRWPEGSRLLRGCWHDGRHRRTRVVRCTCVNTGCIPTKTLIASAYAIHMARRAADFGVVVDGPVRADMARVKARKDTISGQSRSGLEESLKTLENCTVYRGHARFASPHAPDDSRRPRCRKGRDPRLHEDAGRCRQPGNPGCGHSRDRR